MVNPFLAPNAFTGQAGHPAQRPGGGAASPFMHLLATWFGHYAPAHPRSAPTPPPPDPRWIGAIPNPHPVQSRQQRGQLQPSPWPTSIVPPIPYQ